MTVMLVEDSPRVRDLIKEIIREGVKSLDGVFDCKNGLEAIEQYEQHHPDWVLMDIEMDRMDGLSASKNILKRFPDAKIMFVTQFDDPLYRERARKLGAYAYVLKEDLMDIPVLLKNILV